jgi:hypothetical protein
MKTTKNILIASVLLVLSMSVNAGNYNTNSPSGSNNSSITYQVTVHMTPDVLAFQGAIYIGITDEHGKLIGPRQLVDRGSNRPILFKEKGTMRGTRTAVLYAMPAVNDHVTVTAAPDQINGIFDAGDVYQFNLYPVLVKTPSGITP